MIPYSTTPCWCLHAPRELERDSQRDSFRAVDPYITWCARRRVWMPWLRPWNEPSGLQDGLQDASPVPNNDLMRFTKQKPTKQARFTMSLHGQLTSDILSMVANGLMSSPHTLPEYTPTRKKSLCTATEYLPATGALHRKHLLFAVQVDPHARILPIDRKLIQ